MQRERSYIYASRLVWPGDRVFSHMPETGDWREDPAAARALGEACLRNCPEGTELVILRREVGVWEEVTADAAA